MIQSDPLSAGIIEEQFKFTDLKFGWIDYGIFGSLIGLSLLIGLYHGVCSKQNNIKEYLFGGKTMGYVPVAISMLAGHVSGITLLGVPTEAYEHGASYLLVVITLIIFCAIVPVIFLPVFYRLQLASTYEYLELRFSPGIRRLASILYIVSLMIYIPIVIYVPALAIAQVSGFGLYAIAPVLCLVCIVYTSLGGVKAVIWTDTIQFGFTTGGLVLVFYLGIRELGGFTTAWSIAEQGNRTVIFNFSPSLYVRKSFWAMTISMPVHMVAGMGVGQNPVQRFLSIPTEQGARKAILLMCLGMAVMKVICCLTGILMYAHYHDCDPLKAQVLPYYVMDIAGDLPGLPGIFLAGLVSCALSTMSSSLNTLAGTIYDDFVDPWMPESVNDAGAKGQARATNIMKVFAVIIGLIGMCSVFVVEHLGTVFEMSLSVRSIAEGPLLGFFVLAMLVPWVGSRGALAGGLVSVVVTAWLVVGRYWYTYLGRLKGDALPTSIDGCRFRVSGLGNETLGMGIVDGEEDTEDPEPLGIFRTSPLHLVLIATVVSVLTGLVVSHATGETREVDKVNPEYITPLMQRFLPSKDSRSDKAHQYKEVALKEVSGGVEDKVPTTERLPAEGTCQPDNCCDSLLIEKTSALDCN